MATWDVEVHQARAVMRQAEQAAGGCGQRMTAARGRVDQMVALAQCSPTVAEALQGHLRAVEGDRRAADERVGTVTSAGHGALDAYNQGDHEMVLNAQRNASSAPDPSGQMPGGAAA